MGCGTKTNCRTFHMFNKMPSGYSVSGFATSYSFEMPPDEDLGSSDAIWTDGTNIFASDGDTHLVLNGNKWERKTWNGGASKIYGYEIWTDGTNIYSTRANGGTDITHWVLNGDTWEEMMWNGIEDIKYFFTRAIWTDGTNIFYSSASTHRVLNGNTWETKTWEGLSSFNSSDVWTDGTNIFCSTDNTQFGQKVLNNGIWETKKWNGVYPIGRNIVTLGTDTVYLDSGSYKWYVLNGDTWEEFTWNGAFVYPVTTQQFWTDGKVFYFGFPSTLSSNKANVYVLLPKGTSLYTKVDDYSWRKLCVLC